MKGTDHFYSFYRVSYYYYYFYFCMISSMGSLGDLKKTLFQAFQCRKNPGTYLNRTLAQSILDLSNGFTGCAYANSKAIFPNQFAFELCYMLSFFSRTCG